MNGTREFSKIPKFPLFRNTETLRLSRLTYLGSQRFFFSRERKLRRRGAKENAERIKKMWLFLHFYLLGIGPLEPGRTDKRHQSIMSAQTVLLDHNFPNDDMTPGPSFTGKVRLQCQGKLAVL